MFDMAHFAGLVAAGLHPNPVAALRHRHLDDAQDARRAARRASSSAARSTRRRSTAPSSPGLQGGPLVPRRSRPRRRASRSPRPSRSATTSARCARTPTRSPRQLQAAGIDVLTGGTDTHLVQLDLRATEWTGKDAEERLHEVELTVNRNTVPFDERPPTVASGVRVGTPARDDARLRRGRLPRGRRGSSSTRSPTTPTSPRSPRAPTALLRAPPALPGVPRLHELRGVTAAVDDGRLTHVTHPLVQHKLTLLRDRSTPTRPLPQARQRADAAAHVRGDEGLRDRAGRDRDAARDDDGAARSRARRSPSARSCAPASACSTACSR